LNLMTLHSSKGLEFDVVFMLGMDEGIEPPWWIKKEEGFSERRRLFFVGFTRARNEVHMMYSGWHPTRYGRRNDGPSRFLIELSKRLKESETKPST
jgi:DNA helicase II / ATP-dependent DNA helicase PcrA